MKDGMERETDEKRDEKKNARENTISRFSVK